MNTLYNAPLITFEGIDTCGKTTQIRYVIDTLNESPYVEKFGSPIYLREPGGTGLSESVRQILLDIESIALTVEAELLLFAAARAELTERVIKPSLQQGHIVLLDRFYDSTTAYQGHGRGIPLDRIRKVNHVATGGLVPDLTLLIDIEVEEIGRRSAHAGLRKDRMESAGIEFYSRVRKGYLELVTQEPQRFRVVNGQQSRESCQKEIMAHIDALLNKYRN